MLAKVPKAASPPCAFEDRGRYFDESDVEFASRFEFGEYA